MNTVAIDTKTINLILDRLEKLARDVKAIKTGLIGKEPPYGSNEWWEWSDKEALKEIKTDKGIRFNSAEDAIKWLNS